MKCIPKKFCCGFPLKLGAVLFGILLLCILVLTGIVVIFQIAYIKDCDSCKFFAWRNCFAYSITALIYVLIMIGITLWYFHGIRTEKASVVLSFSVASALWLALIFVLLLVLVILYFTDGDGIGAPIVALIFLFIAMGILVYGLMVTIAYWLELRQSKQSAPPQTA